MSDQQPELERAGVRHHHGDPRAVVAEYDQRGWQVGWMSGGRERREVLRRVGEALEFPHWYGVNLDAMWDCLTDLTEPTVLVWEQWQDFAVEHPSDFAALLSVWRDRAAQAPPFAVVVLS